MKTILLFTLILYSHIAYALGPEEQEFIGIVGNNKIIALSFKADPNLYGSKVKQLINCTLTNKAIACRNEVNNEPVVTYKIGNQSSKYFKPAQRLYNQLYPGMKIGTWNPNGVYANDFFECKLGCSATTPKFFILITHGD